MFGRSKSNSGVRRRRGDRGRVRRPPGSGREGEQRALAAVESAIAAKRRTKRQRGKTGLAYRLATDLVLRMQVIEMYMQLEKARRRVDKRRSHRLGTCLSSGGASPR